MKLFISHAWQDKTAAHQIAESMGRYADVWLDVKHLKPGDAIQPCIDDAMTSCDVVIVVWSRSAARSKGVKAEIETAQRLSLRRLPVLIDRTRLDRQPALAGLYGVELDPAEPLAGLLRIQAAAARLMLGPLGLDDAETLNALTEFEGLHQYVAEYRSRRGIAGKDSLDWALKAMRACTKAHAELGALRDRVGNTLQTLQDSLGEVQAADDDPQRIAAILGGLRNRPDAASTEMRTLIDFVQGKLDSLAADDSSARSAVRKLRGRPVDATPAAADPRLEPVLRYIQAAPVALQAFTRLAQAGQSPALRDVAASLQHYLHAADDLVPDSTHPVYGFIDDAWLIHNTLYRCVEGGLFAAAQIPVDWGALVQADAAVVALLPPVARQRLEALLLQLMQAIAQEQQAYQPSFVQQALMGAYAAWMGQGDAVRGGARDRTIDDIYFGGGKMHLYTGP